MLSGITQMARSTEMLPVSWIPNTDGYRFIGVLTDDTTVDCEVVKGWFRK